MVRGLQGCSAQPRAGPCSAAADRPGPAVSRGLLSSALQAAPPQPARAFIVPQRRPHAPLGSPLSATCLCSVKGAACELCRSPVLVLHATAPGGWPLPGPELGLSRAACACRCTNMTAWSAAAGMFSYAEKRLSDQQRGFMCRSRTAILCVCRAPWHALQMVIFGQADWYGAS